MPASPRAYGRWKRLYGRRGRRGRRPPAPAPSGPALRARSALQLPQATVDDAECEVDARQRPEPPQVGTPRGGEGECGGAGAAPQRGHDDDRAVAPGILGGDQVEDGEHAEQHGQDREVEGLARERQREQLRRKPGNEDHRRREGEVVERAEHQARAQESEGEKTVQRRIRGGSYPTMPDGKPQAGAAASSPARLLASLLATVSGNLYLLLGTT